MPRFHDTDPQPDPFLAPIVADIRSGSEFKESDGRFTQSFRFERYMFEGMPDDELQRYAQHRMRDTTHRLGIALARRLLNAGRHTVNIVAEGTRRVRAVSDQEYRVTTDICPVRERVIEVAKLVYVDPKPKIVHVDRIVEKIVEAPAATVGERLRSWWAEMTSPVVYDGPTGREVV